MKYITEEQSASVCNENEWNTLVKNLSLKIVLRCLIICLKAIFMSIFWT